MSDLISRKKVLDILEKEKSLRCGYDADIAIFSIEKGIRELPTSRMNEALEKIISQITELANYNGDAYLDSADVIEIVQDVAEEYKGGWISVKDGLPDKAGSYLVIGKSGGATVTRWYMPSEFYPEGHFGGNSADYIRYWMPRPEQPKDRD